MQGRIIKGIAGFYYVRIKDAGIYECKAKGIFRKEKRKPLVGDYAEIEVLDEKGKKGNLTELLPRSNALIRPAVANIDQALVIFSVREPAPNQTLLDRFLVSMERQEIPVVICINKQDLAHEGDAEELKESYAPCGYRLIFTSARREEGLEELREVLRGKTTAVAGPSGVGKSSLTNLLQREIQMETGEISKKLGRGRHTTRHSQLIELDETTYLMDTPGFTSFYTEDLEKEELRHCFPEFAPYEGRCRFQGCTHTHEPGCALKEALAQGKVSTRRYESYCEMYRELEEKRRY